MRNICPHCGKIIESGEQAFDLTMFLKTQVRRYLSSVLGRDEKKAMYVQGMEKYFNSMAADYPLVFTEKKLWEMPSVQPESPSVVKTVLFRFPYDEVKERMETFAEANDEFCDWFNKNSTLIKKMVFRLNLRKMSGGEICFDTIVDDFDATPIARSRVCPHRGCHGKLSFWAGRYREICMSVLGGPRVSKTTTLTAMAYAFLHGYQNILWEGSQSDETYLEFEKSCLEPYSKGYPISATELVKNNIPRISFRVTLANTGYIILTFVDLPGELNNENGIDQELYRRYQHYFDHVDFIWYCTDPGELIGLEDGAHNGNLADQLGYDEGRAALRTTKICNNMNLMQGFFNRTGKVIPVAYILGKTDSAIISRADKTNYHLYEPQSYGRLSSIVDSIPLDLEQFYREASRVRQYMMEKNVQLIRTFEGNFSARCYFAMSAYGWNPKETTSPRTPDSYKCTAPFIWMLACSGLIPIRVMKKKRTFFGEETVQSSLYLANCNEKDRETILYNLHMKGHFRIFE